MEVMPISTSEMSAFATKNKGGIPGIGCGFGRGQGDKDSGKFGRGSGGDWNFIYCGWRNYMLYTFGTFMGIPILALLIQVPQI